MSDDGMNRILAVLERLQSRMDSLDQHLTIGLGHTNDALRQIRSVSEDHRIHSEQLRSFQNLVRKLEARVSQLEDKLGQAGRL